MLRLVDAVASTILQSAQIVPSKPQTLDLKNIENTSSDYIEKYVRTYDVRVLYSEPSHVLFKGLGLDRTRRVRSEKREKPLTQHSSLIASSLCEADKETGTAEEESMNIA